MQMALGQIKKVFCLLTISVLVGSACSKKDPVDPVASDISDLKIDPDQRALPADGSENSGENIAETTKAGDLPSDVPPTPTVEELSSTPPSKSSETVEPEPPAISNEVAPVSGSEIEGSGPQVRYVKAAELNIRQEPNRYSKIVGKVLGGAKVKVKIEGGWARLDEGRWIRSRWLVKKPPSRFDLGVDNQVPTGKTSVHNKLKKNVRTKKKRN